MIGLHNTLMDLKIGVDMCNKLIHVTIGSERLIRNGRGKGDILRKVITDIGIMNNNLIIDA